MDRFGLAYVSGLEGALVVQIRAPSVEVIREGRIAAKRERAGRRHCQVCMRTLATHELDEFGDLVGERGLFFGLCCALRGEIIVQTSQGRFAEPYSQDMLAVLDRTGQDAVLV